ncbi:MAG: DUF2281 domain-containing protein [Dyadobacter sp.]|uniref:DUF2281 domain-containing protein n=1 Tax=Dyadobacter sp. TaxID=1914288 RepID=UPI0032679FF9
MMLTTVRGTYENGRVILEEPLPTPYAKVIVTVLEEEKPDEKKVPEKPRRQFGIMKGSITLPDDFNDPLDELSDYM